MKKRINFAIAFRAECLPCPSNCAAEFWFSHFDGRGCEQPRRGWRRAPGPPTATGHTRGGSAAASRHTIGGKLSFYRASIEHRTK
jgi:hypothetical protein